MKLLRYITEKEESLLRDYSTKEELVIDGASHTHLYYGVSSKLNNSKQTIDQINELSILLSNVIEGFKGFSNFTKGGRLRFQYNWSNTFTGVGYITINELKNGFESKEKES